MSTALCGLPPNRIIFSYGGVDFFFDDRGFINLTAMWQANNSPLNKDPREWRRQAGQGFIESLARSLNVGLTHIIKGERGKGGSTWGHWQIGLAYAKYLSHEFHRAANDALVHFWEEEANPAIKMQRAAQLMDEKGDNALALIQGLQATLSRHDVQFHQQGTAIAQIQQKHDELTLRVDQVSAAVLLPTRVIPNDWGRIYQFALDHGIELDASQKAKAADFCTKACKQWGVVPIPHQGHDRRDVASLYPTWIMGLWLSIYRKDNPRIAIVIFPTMADPAA